MVGKTASGLVRLTVSVPRGVLALLADVSRFGGVQLEPKAWIEEEVLASARGLIDCISNKDYIKTDILTRRYGLDEVQAKTGQDP